MCRGYKLNQYHGRRRGGPTPPLDFETIGKKTFFCQFRGLKTKFHHFCPPPWKKFWENPLLHPLEKLLPTPMISTNNILSMWSVLTVVCFTMQPANSFCKPEWKYYFLVLVEDREDFRGSICLDFHELVSQTCRFLS